MEEQLVSFETAKLAKEVGFNLCTYDSYDRYGNLRWHDPNPPDHNNISSSGNVSAPTQSLLQKWLREEHNLLVFVEPFGGADDYPMFTCDIVDLTHSSSRINIQLDRISTPYEKQKESAYKEYEQALEKGLQETLKIIKNK